MQLLPLSVSLVLSLTFSVAQADWPQFRGPNHQGHAAQTSALPTQWSPTENVAWKVEIPGEGWSSPVIQGDHLILTSAIPINGGGYTLSAICFDARDGSERWRKAIFEQDASAPNIHQKNSHASPTPVIEGNRVYVHFGHQGTACLDLDGEIIWKTNEISYAPVHGNGGSPVLVDGKLVFGVDGGSDPMIVALEANTGQIAWKTPRNSDAKKNFSFSTPLVIGVDGSQQIVSPCSELIAAYDPADGREIWRVRHSGYSVIPRPIYAHGLIFVSTGYDSARVLAIKPTGVGDVTETHLVWEQPRSAPHTPSLIAVKQEIYMVSDGGVAACVDPANGEIIWRERLGGSFSASPIHAAGKLYFTNEEGTTYVVNPSREFDLIAENDLDERTLASAAVSCNALFLRTVSHLYRIEERRPMPE